MQPEIRQATDRDLASIIELLADDEIGSGREMPDDRATYESSYRAITTDPNQLLIVADLDGHVVATLQMTFIPGLSRRGTWRAQIEGMRVASGYRGDGVGAAMMTWAIETARQHDCRLVQLTSDARRSAAHRFYERFGFVASHSGFKLSL